MPAVHSGLVLVTGATGFIGAQIARQILDAGFAVRLTARTAAKAEYLSKNFDGKVETVIVKDITAPGAFDAAVVGIDAVVNAASPVDLALKGDPALITGPAVAGIMRLLEALDNFSEAKRVIHISSVCTAGGDPATYDGPLTFTEADWNDRDLDTVNTLGAEATGQEKYDGTCRSQYAADRPSQQDALGARVLDPPGDEAELRRRSNPPLHGPRQTHPSSL